MYETILLPTDGSGPSDAARDHAISLASTYDADLHVVYAVDDDTLRSARIDSDVVVAGFEEEGKRLVEEVAAAAEAAGVSCETTVIHGSPAEVITDYAAEHDIDLVVMGTHGRHGVQRILLGSVTERVVRTSTVPVLTVQGDDADIEPPEGDGDG